MAITKQIVRQRDFSGGEIDPQAKRRDDVAQVRAGARSLLNWRIESAGDIRDRPGRWSLFPQEGRTETILMPGDVRFRVSFGNGTIVIRDANGSQVATNSGYPWTNATAYQITFAIVNRDIFITFPGSVPQVARYTVGVGWSFFAFTFQTGSQGELRAPFYRFPETNGLTMLPSAATGSIMVTMSGSFFVSQHVGCTVRFKERQILITHVTSPTVATGTVVQQLPPAQVITFASTAGFFIGDEVAGQTSNATGEVTAITSTALTVQLKGLFSGFEAGEIVVGPNSQLTSSSTAVTTTTLQPSTEWDEQAISPYRGWPRSCLYDRSRLTLCDLPGLPEGILWSATSAAADFLVGTDATAAMFEIAPGRKRVLYMTGGPDQFVFTNLGVYSIPVNSSSPLQPGSVSFVRITSQGVGQIQPVETMDGIVFMNVGLTRVMAIQQTGAYTKPYRGVDISELSSHLFASPVCLAAYTGDGDFPERYVYVVNMNGTMAIGRFQDNGTDQWIGWVPFSGVGFVNWVSSLGAETIFSTSYGSEPIVEVLYDDALLDGQVNYGTLNYLATGAGTPAEITGDPLEYFGTTTSNPFNPAAGKGPLWMYAGLTVDFNDSGKDMGSRTIDANGFVIPILGDDFSSETIVAGFAWPMEFEPFIPHSSEGPDRMQGERRRRIITACVTVIHSVGFTWANREVPPYNWGDEASEPPIEQENSYRFRMTGRSYDPRVQLTRERPGPIQIMEVSLEVTD